jgi:predicted RNA-binding protein associated with RNAse of E/G family
MQAAFENRNYDCIKILAKKTKSLEKYIDLCNSQEKYQAIKKILIDVLVKRNNNETRI